MLPAISADYMLERTNVYINNSSAQQVADRIAESLGRQSLSYKESDERKVRPSETDCNANQNSHWNPLTLVFFAFF